MAAAVAGRDDDKGHRRLDSHPSFTHGYLPPPPPPTHPSVSNFNLLAEVLGESVLSNRSEVGAASATRFPHYPVVYSAVADAPTYQPAPPAAVSSPALATLVSNHRDANCFPGASISPLNLTLSSKHNSVGRNSSPIHLSKLSRTQSANHTSPSDLISPAGHHSLPRVTSCLTATIQNPINLSTCENSAFSAKGGLQAGAVSVISHTQLSTRHVSGRGVSTPRMPGAAGVSGRGGQNLAKNMGRSGGEAHTNRRVPPPMATVNEGHTNMTEARCCGLVVPDLESLMCQQDCDEIKELQQSFMTCSANMGSGFGNIKPEDLSQFYSHFIRKRALFLVGTPLYKTLAAEDRPRQLHLAVAMSTYFTGAHLINTSDYTFQHMHDCQTRSGRPVVAASTIRQILSHQEFVHLMRFYNTYSTLYKDQVISIIMQVMSLFLPESGLAEPRMAEQGRLHYINLLSRYTVSVWGSTTGTQHLATLLRSQQEARQLVLLLQHVELKPQVACADVSTNKLVTEGIELVCKGAQETLCQVLSKREGGGTRQVSPLRPAGDPIWKGLTITAASTERDQADFVKTLLLRLADCDDPDSLAAARRILPADLLRRFLQQVQQSSWPADHATPPDPSSFPGKY